jgi:hypothetical protein
VSCVVGGLTEVTRTTGGLMSGRDFARATLQPSDALAEDNDDEELEGSDLRALPQRYLRFPSLAAM